MKPLYRLTVQPLPWRICSRSAYTSKSGSPLAYSQTCPEEASNKKRERLFAKRQKQPIFEVNNDGGNHRSRLVVEAFHYVKTGTHFADEYKGYENHLIYDCCSGYLLPLEEVEIELKNIK